MIAALFLIATGMQVQPPQSLPHKPSQAIVPAGGLAKPTNNSLSQLDELDEELTRVELDLLRKELKRLTAADSLNAEVKEKIDQLHERIRAIRSRLAPAESGKQKTPSGQAP